MKKGNMISCTFRLNLNNPDDLKLYEYLQKGAEERSISMAAFIRDGLHKIYNENDIEKRLRVLLNHINDTYDKQQEQLVMAVQEEMHQHDIKVLGTLASVSGKQEVHLSPEVEQAMPLPKEEDELPEGVSGVLSMFQ